MQKPKNPLYFKLFKVKPRKGDLRRYEIIETALALMAKEGGEALNLDRIAKAMKIGRSHVVYYFPNKESLLKEVLELTIATGHEFLVECLTHAKTPADQLEGYLDATFQWCKEHPEHFYAIFLMWEFAIKDKVFMELSERFRHGGRERLQQIISSGWKKKITEKEAKRLAREAHNILVANILELFCSASGLSAGQMKELTHRSILTLLGKNFV